METSSYLLYTSRPNGFETYHMFLDIITIASLCFSVNIRFYSKIEVFLFYIDEGFGVLSKETSSILAVLSKQGGGPSLDF